MAVFYDLAQSPQYRSAVLDNEYIIEEGVFLLPIAEEAPTTESELQSWSPVETVKAHAPYRVRKVRFNYDKGGTPPAIPSPSSTGAFKFLGGSIIFSNPNTNLTLESYDWSVSGLYLYVEDCRSSIADGFVLGSHPFLSNTQYTNSTYFAPANPTIGAIAQAGTDARIGVTQSQTITSTGNWLYNTASYYPSAVLTNDEILNGSIIIPSTVPPVPSYIPFVQNLFLFGQPDEPTGDPNQDSPDGSFGGGGDF